MQRESEEHFMDLKVILLSTERSLETPYIRQYFMKFGFYLIKSSEYRFKIYGDNKKFQEVMKTCPYDINLRKIRNKRFYEKIY